MAVLLFSSVFVIATCGLVYELISGALASYLLGDSITQFSTIIGVYLFAMGIGSYLSKYVTRNLLIVFIQVELILGLVGGCSATILFLAFEHVTHFRVLLYSLVSLTGMLVGLEIPLLMRILKDKYEFKDLVSNIFTFDYVGALLASLLFPLVLVPHLGLMRSAFMFGIFNVLVALWAIIYFGKESRWSRLLQTTAFSIVVFLGFGFAYADRLLELAENFAYQHRVIYAKTTTYQRIVLTKQGDDLRLFLNGNLQFSSRDEYRYHEALVHVGLGSVKNPKKVLILGGGDGMAAREVLKYKSVETITLVDLDKDMTKLFSHNELLVKLNENSLNSEKVTVLNQDAFLFLREQKEKFDFIIVDFPDPSNFSIGKLYTNAFYRTLNGALGEGGMFVVQSTSPYAAKKSFWCVDTTIKSVGFQTAPYHAYVPSFGEWGFILAAKSSPVLSKHYLNDLKFVNFETVKAMTSFSADMQAEIKDINKLNNQVLVRYFENEWAEYFN